RYHTTIHPLSLHDALPIFRKSHLLDDQCREQAHLGEVPLPHTARYRKSHGRSCCCGCGKGSGEQWPRSIGGNRTWRFSALEALQDRKSTRLNSSHVSISYA